MLLRQTNNQNQVKYLPLFLHTIPRTRPSNPRQRNPFFLKKKSSLKFKNSNLRLGASHRNLFSSTSQISLSNNNLNHNRFHQRPVNSPKKSKKLISRNLLNHSQPKSVNNQKSHQLSNNRIFQIHNSSLLPLQISKNKKR